MLLNRNNTNYPLSLANELKSIVHSEDDSLQYHQRIIFNFVTGSPDTRGIIVFNETGSGKTITAASIALHMRETRDIVFMSAKSLHSNFRQDIHKFIQKQTAEYTPLQIDTMIDAQFSFISTNASNMMTKVDQLGKTTADIKYEEQMGLVSTANLDNKLVIVDEAHNLFNSIVGGSTNAQALYTTIMNAQNIKILFLTGTPIVNDPFELVPAYNMCAGWNLLPTDYTAFYETFIDNDNKIKNYHVFVNRIYGLTSYYGSWYQTGGIHTTKNVIKRKGFPDELPLKIEVIPMSHEQYSIYKAARLVERESITRKKYEEKQISLRKPKGRGASYRVYSRQACNYALAREKANDGTPIKKDINSIPTATLLDLDNKSPKMKRIIDNINLISNRTQVVYSSFVSGEGIGIFARVLVAMGWSSYTIQNTKPGINTFAVFSGDILPADRDATLDVFNSPQNANGSIIRLLLISGAGSEGINIYNCAAIHIMEPYWNWNRIFQVIARVVRWKGHPAFADQPHLQVVQPYLYISDYPPDVDVSKINEPTTDVQLMKNSTQNRLLNERFYGAMIVSSIDCPVHIQNASEIAKKSIKCLSCSPTNTPLFNKDIITDLASKNPCKPLKEKEVSVKEIIYMGKKYYYSQNDGVINLYEFKKSLNGYVAVQPGNLAYSPIIEQLTQI